jgi:hypothetical protein
MDQKPLRILRLTLKDQPSYPWFTLTRFRVKKFEVRENSDWIRSRLYDKYGDERYYDRVEYRHGYSKHAPAIICRYNGFTTGRAGCINFVGPTGKLIFLQFKESDFLIFNGEVLSEKNIIQW